MLVPERGRDRDGNTVSEHGHAHVELHHDRVCVRLLISGNMFRNRVLWFRNRILGFDVHESGLVWYVWIKGLEFGVCGSRCRADGVGCRDHGFRVEG